MYDSTVDAKAHIAKVQFILNNIIIPELVKRAEDHDKTKLEDPEKKTYDTYIPMLQKVEYGTSEYNKIKAEMAKTGGNHHYIMNRHHPEHFSHGIRDMTLVDIMEMFCDWFAASLRSDTDFKRGLFMNADRYNISEDLYEIFYNTYKEYFKDQTEQLKKI